MSWTKDEEQFLAEHYPKKGKDWCMRVMGKSEAQVRQKASRMGLKARGVSEAWHRKQREHAEILTGRKRPDQSEVMKRLHREGKLKKTPQQNAATGARLRDYFKRHGHPRGMLGKQHSSITKDVISRASKMANARATQAQKQARLLKGMKTRERNATLVPARPHGSWKAGWREVGGKRCYFRSRWEANYARYLEWLKDRKQIVEWEHEPETFWFEGVKRGCVSYLPDFRVTEPDGTVRYHEVKGWMDARSKTKLRRMKKYHPKVELVLIQAAQYREIETKIGRLIEGWEMGKAAAGDLLG